MTKHQTQDLRSIAEFQPRAIDPSRDPLSPSIHTPFAHRWPYYSLHWSVVVSQSQKKVIFMHYGGGGKWMYVCCGALVSYTYRSLTGPLEGVLIYIY